MTRPKVSALLVSHDGMRWLPGVLDALAGQSRPVDEVVAVDTSSEDGSSELLREWLGPDAVHTAPPSSTFAAAVRTGLGGLPDATENEWVWILHDDSGPAPDALEKMLEATAPGVAVLGPKLREWPSLRRLLELGVTISGTGRRETGLERGEYDQGQHDRQRDVLAVNTAGMLVRREVLEQLGFDDRLPVFGTDIDFGWRAARAGHRTVVIPGSVVFHAEAAHRGVRRTPLTGTRFHRVEREAALYTLLVNGSTLGLPWRLLRLFLGSVLRMIGFLLVRSPGESFDELGAVARTYLRPDRIIAGRAARRRTATVPHKEVKHLLAPVWLPYRHGLDVISDVASAVVNQAADLTAARRARALAETGPVAEDTENVEDTGLVARLVTNRVAWVFAALLVLATAGMRGHVGSGMLSGGALLPPPETVGHWWARAFQGWHDLGVGSTVASAPYLLPLAAAGTILFGKAWLLVDVIFFFAVPLAAWGGFRFLRLVTDSLPAALWGAVAYGIVPVLSGSVQQGRLGSVVAAIVLPWLAHSAVFLGSGISDRRWRAAFRSAMWLALVAAFAPLAFGAALVAGGVGLLVCLLVDRGRFAQMWAPVATALAVAGALLFPWVVLIWGQRGVSSWLLEAGRPASGLIGRLSSADIVLGRPGDLGSAPAWLSAGLAVAAVVALLRPDTRRKVLLAWGFVLLGLSLAAALAGLRVTYPPTGSSERIWLGLPLLVVQAAAITAVAIAGSGIAEQLRTHAFGWRQPLGAAVAVVALVTPLLGLAWWAVDGTDGVIDRRPVTSVPPYMTEAAERDASQGVLVVRGSERLGFRYQLLRQPGLRLGDDSVLPSADQQQPLTDLVAELASLPDTGSLSTMQEYGVQFVYAPRPVDQQLAGNLDSLSGLAQASALAPGSRAWRLEGSAQGPPRDDDGRLHQWLVGLECLTLVVVAVFAAPSRRREAS